MSMIWGCRNRRVVATEAIPFDGPLSTEGETYDLHLLVYKTSQTKAMEMKLLMQSKEEGIPTTVFGINTEFKGFGSKWRAVKPWLQELPANSLIVIGHARDVLLNILKNDPSQGKEVIHAFVRSYETLTIDSPSVVIMPAEEQCCVSALTHTVPEDYFDATTGKRRARACALGRDGCHWAGDSQKMPWENLQQQVAEQQTGLDTL